MIGYPTYEDLVQIINQIKFIVMEKTKKSKSNSKVASKFKCVNIKDIERGDVLYIDNSSDAEPYLLIDKGAGNECYILIENLNTHFAYLYHFTNLYKLV